MPRGTEPAKEEHVIAPSASSARRWAPTGASDAALAAPQICIEYVPSFGGSVTSVTDFANALNSRIVTFISPRSMPEPEDRDPRVTYVPSAPSLRGRAYSWASAEATAGAAEMVRKADLVVCHMLYRYHIEWAARVAETAGVPYWVVPHGTLDPYVFTYRSWQKKAWLATQGRRILDRAAGVVFATRGERDKALPHVSHDRRHVIHWPVPMVAEEGAPDARRRIRARFGIPEGDAVLLFMGRLHEMKRPLETISLLAKLGNPSVHLLIVGPEDTITRQQSVDYAAAVGAHNVHVLSPVFGDAKYELFFAADAYISLSHRENFGFTVAEALACACPVILGPGIDLVEDLRTIDCGWLVPSLDDATLLRTLEEFVAASELSLRERGIRGRDWARAHLDFRTFAEKLSALALATVSNSGRG